MLEEKRYVWSRVIAAVALVAAAVFLVGLYVPMYTLRLWSKPWPVLCLAAWVGCYAKGKGARWILVGLFCSVVGDVLLELQPPLFVPGLVAFLIAHLCYIVAFTRQSNALVLWRALPFALWMVSYYVFLFPGIQKQGLVLPVGLYVAVIGVMLWRASATLAPKSLHASYGWIAMMGAITFAISDSMIAWKKFAAPFGASRYLIILTYWLGQWSIAYAAFRPSHEANRP